MGYRYDLIDEEVVHQLFEMVGMDQVANVGEYQLETCLFCHLLPHSPDPNDSDMMEHVVLDMELWSMLSTELQHLLLGWLSMLAENLHQKCNMWRFKQV